MRTLIFSLLAIALCSASANAYNERGMKTYKKLCKQCHGSEFRGAAMLKGDEWKEMFANGEAKLLAAHKDNAEAMEQFGRSYYKSRKEDLFDFLSKSAKDSGVVPGCDANYCGY
jgi:cytochrome c5